jgi:hypothetical protein
VIFISGLRVGRRSPASQEAERLGGLRVGFRCPDRDRQSGVGRELDAVVGEADVADDGVVEVLAAGVVEADIVGCPPGAELCAPGGELADQV